MKRTIALILALALALALTLPAAAEGAPAPLTGTLDAADIPKYGNCYLSITKADLAAAGYAYGDVVTLSFLGQSVDMPYCHDYSDVDSGSVGLFGREGHDRVLAAINAGNFADDYGIASKVDGEDGGFSWVYKEGVTGPVTVTLTMKEPGGYYEQYLLRSLSYSDRRADFPDLTDEQFANFRAVATTGMGANTLYRSASPVNPRHNRNTYADAAIRAAGVTVVMNLENSDAEARSYAGFDSSYYATVQFVPLNMGSPEPLAEEFQTSLARGLRFFAEHPGVYDVHCREGKDRAGLVVALLECFMGAAYDEVIADYMVSYFNYYGVTPEDPRYEPIAHGNIVKLLEACFGVTDLKSADLSAGAEGYFRALGLTDGELSALRANLSADRPAPGTETAAPAGELPAVRTPAAGAPEVCYAAVPGDCLWSLAERYYGDGRLFGRIAGANGIAAPYTILIGQTLVIPGL